MNNPLQLGKVLNTQTQHPDEFLSDAAITVSGFAPIPMADGSVRIAFCEKVFNDGKSHPRGAVVMSKESFSTFVKSLVEFQRMQLPHNEVNRNVGNA
jgi:hypothetical protein